MPYIEQSEIRSKVVEEPYVTIGQVASVIYFMYFLVLNPLRRDGSSRAAVRKRKGR